MPLVGGFMAVSIASTWGGFQSNAGKAVFLIGLGLFLWGCGNLIWTYYNFVLHIPAPYPSLADLVYAPGMFCYGLGVFYLAKINGIPLALKGIPTKIFLIITPLIVLALILATRDGMISSFSSNPVKIFFDITYPLGDFIALTIAIVLSGLSFRYMKGKYAFDIGAVLLGVGFMFIADSIFSYTTTVGSFYNGDFGDLLFTVGTFLLTFGVLGFYTLKEY
jgi:hypothetical protein